MCELNSSARYTPVLYRNGGMDWAEKSSEQKLPYKGIRVSPKIRVLLSGTLSETLNLADFSLSFSLVDRRRCCQLSSTFPSLSNWAFILVYNTWTWRKRRSDRLRQPSLSFRAPSFSFIAARRYASAVFAMALVYLSVRQNPQFYIETAEQAGLNFRRRGYPRFILHCVLREFEYL